MEMLATIPPYEILKAPLHPSIPPHIRRAVHTGLPFWCSRRALIFQTPAKNSLARFLRNGQCLSEGGIIFIAASNCIRNSSRIIIRGWWRWRLSSKMIAICNLPTRHFLSSSTLFLSFVLMEKFDGDLIVYFQTSVILNSLAVCDRKNWNNSRRFGQIDISKDRSHCISASRNCIVSYSLSFFPADLTQSISSLTVIWSQITSWFDGVLPANVLTLSSSPILIYLLLLTIVTNSAVPPVISFYVFHFLTSKVPCGSPAYTAPEICLEEDEFDPKLVDLWSCGVLLYTLLFGKFPWDHPDMLVHSFLFSSDLFLTPQKLFDRIIREPVTFTARDALSSDCKDVISKLLAKDPVDRMNIHQLLAHPWLADEPKSRCSSCPQAS